MAHRYRSPLTWSDVTPKDVYMNRRQLLVGGAALMGAGLQTGGARAQEDALEPNTFEEITSYNNFYEFGTDKGDPKRYANALTIDPRSVKIDGMVDNPGDYAFEDINTHDTFTREDILMVGDTLHTDILGGNKFGVRTVLVLSGNTRAENADIQIRSTGIIPDYVCDSIVG